MMTVSFNLLQETLILNSKGHCVADNVHCCVVIFHMIGHGGVHEDSKEF